MSFVERGWALYKYLNIEVTTTQLNIPFGTMALSSTGDMIAVGLVNGVVTLKDPRTLLTIQSLQCHSGGITSMDISGEILATCGWSKG
jgi:hypothetical protein